ncbi:MAG: TlpA family protein disulfide reductase [Acidobacteria bacterium]|nr:TlpA family protein disulfide reductase [Acidobacteriota bacterium]
MLRILLFFFAAAMMAQQVPCNRTPQLEAALRPMTKAIQGADARNAHRRAVAEDVLKAFPDDFLAHWAVIPDLKRPGVEERKATIERYEKYAAAHAGIQAQALLARALVDQDTPRAIQLFEQSAAQNQWAHLGLADIYWFGRFQDRNKSRAHLEAFFNTCPATTSSEAMSRLASGATPELARKLTPGLRSLAQSTPDVLAAAPVWRTVWSLEFKSRPPQEHNDVRKAVSADAARLEKLIDIQNPAQASLVLMGYQQAGDPMQEKRFGDRLLQEAPGSEVSAQVAMARFRKEHPFPQSSDSAEKKKEYYRVSLATANRILAARPDDTGALITWYSALAEMEDSDPAQLAQAADAVLALIRGGSLGMSPPFPLALARVFMKRKIQQERIRELIEEGRRQSPLMARVPSDRDSEEVRKMEAQSEQFIKIAYADALVDYAEFQGEASLARAAVQTAEAAAEKPDEQLRVLTMKGKLAEIDKQPLDALLLYRAALDLRPKEGAKPKPDKLSDAYERVFAALGGSEVARNLLAKGSRPKAESSTDGRWEQPSKAMAPWQLMDLQGKTWKLAQFEGKTLLINVWATWCGPCRSEHPHFQKLYEKLKDRTDVQVLSFNVDESIGKAEPYMKEGKYTFPVLLAGDYVQELLPLITIPQNWIVDAKSQWRWQQIGFGNADGWEEMMTAKLASVR